MPPPLLALASRPNVRRSTTFGGPCRAPWIHL